MTTTQTLNEARTIERYQVDSSNLAAVGYDPSRQILSVEFHSGAVFHYYGVTTAIFEEFAAAESRGQFYAKRIRGTFAGKPMTGMCPGCKTKGFIGEACSTCGNDTVREIDRSHKD